MKYCSQYDLYSKIQQLCVMNRQTLKSSLLVKFKGAVVFYSILSRDTLLAKTLE